MKYFYLCSKKLSHQLKIIETDTNKTHHVFRDKETLFFWPKAQKIKYINPESISLLKKKHNINKLTIIDRIKSGDKTINIVDHINKTGTSFLVGQTPHKNKPTFPDATQIYNAESGSVVVCYGDKYKNIEKQQEPNKVSGEWIAPISLVWNYVGVKILGVGITKKINKIKV